FGIPDKVPRFTIIVRGESLGNTTARKRRAVFELRIIAWNGLELCLRVREMSVVFIRRHVIFIKSSTVPPDQLFPSIFMVGISVRNAGIPMIRIPPQCRSSYRGTISLNQSDSSRDNCLRYSVDTSS